ncbi:hypothetical protein OIDMADRAFT_51161 [Oidiodendron maius Zn]|uniref:Transcription factor domain-containing protein n=1 Tax=Oidiodendron maius (strain Zn) TaxID=913774 RepID=A0A0C3HQP6_OIDMZ|nr:hypothetical protein OIDMADRAFT_51161 [Oidiodendron maius Zn]
MGILRAEMRRKLWATILELNIQSSIVSGMSFLISGQDWDTEPPANVDDIDISDTTTDPITPKPSTIFTQATFQIHLLQVFRPRLEAIQYSNRIRGEHSYDDALRVGAELSKACRDNKKFISRVNRTRESEVRVTQLNINLFDLSICLFLLILHSPFASKGMEDPHFYFSRKICLETALTMLNYPSSESPTTNQVVDNIFRDDYAQFKIVNGGFLKGIIVYATVAIFQGLSTQLEEDVDRITMEENNVMGRLLLSVFLAQVEATEEGVNPELVILETAKKKLLLCYDLLSARMVGIHDLIPVDTDPSGVPQDCGSPQDFSKDFTFQEWSIDQDIQGSWLQSACKDGVWWHW